jgi:hypothetical protein
MAECDTCYVNVGPTLLWYRKKCIDETRRRAAGSADCEPGATGSSHKRGDMSVTYESRIHLYERLLESDYLTSLQKQLRDLMGPDLGGYDFIIWSDLGRSYDPEFLQEKTGRPKVLIYISDETCSIPLHLVGTCAAIFKAYLPQELPERKLFALPLGYASGVPVYDSIPVNQRSTNVFFSGCAQRSRAGLGQVLIRLAGQLAKPKEHETVLQSSLAPSEPDTVYDWSAAFPDSYICVTAGFSSGLDRATYGAKLCNSKIALCPSGWQSSETFRHCEAMRAGCVLISNRLPSTRLYRNSPIIQLEDWTLLDKTVKDLLQDESRMSQLQNDTLAWWETVCSERAIASFIHQKLQGS